MRTTFGGKESDGIVLGAPDGFDSLVIYLAAEDTLHSSVESLAATFAGRLIRQVSEVAFVLIDIAEHEHDVGHEVVVEGDIVLITAFSSERPVLRPTPAILLALKNHIQRL